MKKTEFRYFMEDVLGALSEKFERNFLYIASHNFIAKEATRDIFIKELKKEKPKYKILKGAFLVFDSIMNQYPQVSIYEVIDLVEHFKKCMSSKFKTIRMSARHIILRLFAALYFEYVLMPGRSREDRKEFLDKFRKHFPLNDILQIFNSGVFWRYYFQAAGIDIKGGPEGNDQLKQIIEDFYGAKLQARLR